MLGSIFIGYSNLYESLSIVDGALEFDIGRLGNVLYGLLFWALIPVGVSFLVRFRDPRSLRAQMQSFTIGLLVSYLSIANVIRYSVLGNTGNLAEGITLSILGMYVLVLILTVAARFVPKQSTRSD